MSFLASFFSALKKMFSSQKPAAPSKQVKPVAPKQQPVTTPPAKPAPQAARPVVTATQQTPAQRPQKDERAPIPAPKAVSVAADIAVAEPPVRKASQRRMLPAHVTDKAFLAQFTGDNVEKQKKYVGVFMNSATRILGTLNDCLEARDYPAIKVAAHSLKPQLGYMGIKEEVSHIHQLEEMALNNPDYEQIKNEIIDLERVCKQAFAELKDFA